MPTTAGPKVQGSESSAGNEDCIMCYSDTREDRIWITLQILFKHDAPLPMTYSTFCTGGSFECYGHLCVRD